MAETNYLKDFITDYLVPRGGVEKNYGHYGHYRHIH